MIVAPKAAIDLAKRFEGFERKVKRAIGSLSWLIYRINTPVLRDMFMYPSNRFRMRDGLVSLLAGKYAMMNFIPYNSVNGLEFKRPSWERAAQLAGYLHQHGIVSRLRDSAGQDIDGGCGQLRARSTAVLRRAT